MPKYLVQLTHSDDHVTCVKVLDTIQQQGSHLLTHLHWGCRTGVHSGWMIDEFASREEALQIVPVQFRDEVRIVEIDRFTKDDIAAMVAALED